MNLAALPATTIVAQTGTGVYHLLGARPEAATPVASSFANFSNNFHHAMPLLKLRPQVLFGVEGCKEPPRASTKERWFFSLCQDGAGGFSIYPT